MLEMLCMHIWQRQTFPVRMWFLKSDFNFLIPYRKKHNKVMWSAGNRAYEIPIDYSMLTSFYLK